MNKYSFSDESGYENIFNKNDSNNESIIYENKPHELINEKITIDLIADYFIAWSNLVGDYISNLKLQKLVYYAQAWHLTNFDKPLFDAKFEAWVHGPVNPCLYSKYKKFSWHPIEKDLSPDDLERIKKSLGEDKSNFMQEIIDEYFGETAYALEQLTHLEEPWLEARKGLEKDEPSSKVILESTMKEYYGSF